MINKQIDLSEIHEECGVFGVFNCDHASEISYYALHSLQHRGQEACGIVSQDKGQLKIIKGMGLVAEVFNDKNLKTLKGRSAIGHVRYSNLGNGIENVQPFLFRHHTGDFAIAHNGNIVNSKEIRMFLEKRGSIFQSDSDSEILGHLIKKDTKSERIEVMKTAFNMLEGAFAYVIETKDKLYGVRDKYGIRPLAIGKLNGGYVLSSETCAFEVIGAKYIRDVEPGEIVIISDKGLESTLYSEFKHHYMCAMEYIYFARPDSDIENCNVHAFRKESGKLLARNDDVDADICIGVPDSSISCAIGYAEEKKIPYEIGLIKNKYVGRTFIAPSQELREKGVRMKLSAVHSIVEGKNVVMVDDSIVRGTTSKRIVNMLKEAGAKSVHVRIGSPEFKNPCFYGVDTTSYEELISARLDVEGVRKEIGADSLKYLSVEDLYKAGKRAELCVACFDGHYPTDIYSSFEEANKDGKF
ncbi:MAG: amidophosphoribosyltransferase [Clostridia bacterium]